MGGPTNLPHYPMGWAMVSSTPFRLYKINTHQGGHQVPFIVHWPAGLSAAGELRTQYQHITDLLPTLAELCEVKVPTTKGGRPVPEPAGASMVPTLDDGDIATTHPEQYYEQIGHRGFYRDGWSAVTCRQPRKPFSEEQWELHNLHDDPTETNDLAAEHPEKLRELQDAWEDAAWANQVFPLDEGNYVKMMAQPPWNAELAEPITLRPGMPTVERWRSLQLISSRSFTVEIDVDLADGDDGVLVAHGDQGGGYSLAIDDGRLIHAHNGYGDMTIVDCGPVAAGRRTITLEVADIGDVTWEPRVLVDGEQVAEAGQVPRLMAMAPFEGIDVGIDRRSPVNWELYERKGVARFTGTIHGATFTPGDLAPDNGSQYLQMLKEMGTKYE
jgi:arylsulfatase